MCLSWPHNYKLLIHHEPQNAYLQKTSKCNIELVKKESTECVVFPDSTALPIFLPPLCEWCRCMGDGGSGSVHNTSSLLLLTSYTLPLLQCMIFHTGDNPLTASTWVPSTGCSPSGMDCSSVGSLQVTVAPRKPSTVWALLSTGPQVLTGACSSAGSPQVADSFSALTPVPVWGSLWVAGGWISAPPLTAMGCRGTTSFTMIFTKGCREICSGA